MSQDFGIYSSVSTERLGVGKPTVLAAVLVVYEFGPVCDIAHVEERSGAVEPDGLVLTLVKQRVGETQSPLCR